MHPTCRQVPPRKGSFSTTTVFSPSSPARIAATYPPGPLPIIATSYFATRSLPSAEPGPVTGHGDRIAAAPLSHSKKLEGGRPKKAGACLTNAILNVQKAARAYGADGCVPANKKF